MFSENIENRENRKDPRRCVISLKSGVFLPLGGLDWRENDGLLPLWRWKLTRGRYVETWLDVHMGKKLDWSALCVEKIWLVRLMWGSVAVSRRSGPERDRHRSEIRTGEVQFSKISENCESSGSGKCEKTRQSINVKIRYMSVLIIQILNTYI
jgi:hypothetical protein